MSENSKITSESLESEDLLWEIQYQLQMLQHTHQAVESTYGIDTLKEEKDRLKSHIHEKELENQKLKSQLGETRRLLESQTKSARQRKFILWSLSLWAAIMSSIGTNFVTGDNQAVRIPGGTMIFIAVALETLSFLIACIW